MNGASPDPGCGSRRPVAWRSRGGARRRGQPRTQLPARCSPGSIAHPLGLLLAALVLPITASGCSDALPRPVDGGLVAMRCTPGQALPCVCPNGSSGAQRCDTGGAYGTCVCGHPDAAWTDLGLGPDTALPTDVEPPDATIIDAASMKDGDATPGTDTPAAAADAPCPPGSTRCGALCRELATDLRNCGACGQACANGETCIQGMCQSPCGAGQTNCNGVCMTLGMPCVVGVGACMRTGTTLCGTSRVPTCSVSAGPAGREVCDGEDNDCDGLTDEGFCRIGGVCFTDGQANPANECQRCTVGAVNESGPTVWSAASGGTGCTAPVMGVCVGAICGCAPGWENCGGTCRDVDSDAAHCGACGRPCGAGQICVAGACTNALRTCPAGMVLVPAGSFVMGAPPDEPQAQSNERPQRRVTLGAYCLATREATVTEYRRCTQCTTPGTGSNCNWNVAGRDDHPINCIDWSQAVAVCAFLFPGTGRLPTEAEWENAASVAGTRTYPWGSAAPTNQICWTGNGSLQGHTCPVGSFPGGNTPSGIQDLAGNVFEWVSDWFGLYPNADVVNPTGPGTGSTRVARGGGWLNSAPDAHRARLRFPFFPTERVTELGVRCASNPR